MDGSIFKYVDIPEHTLTQASALSPVTIQMIQNIICQTAQESISIIYSEQTPAEYGEKIAYQKGQIDILKFLIQNSEIAKESLQTVVS